MFGRLKGRRRVATRYDKLKATILVTVQNIPVVIGVS